MRIGFLGTGEIGLPTLAAVAAEPAHTLAFVLTQPDRPAGRGLKVHVGSVKQWAEGRGLPVMQPADVNAPDSVAAIRQAGCDLLLVIAFGQYLKRKVRESARHGGINLHASLLPRHRGAAPIPYAILSGDRHTGLTVIQVERRMDAGVMLGRVETPIGPEETAGELHDRLAGLGPALVLRVLDEIAHGRARAEPQNDKLATTAPKLTHESGRIAWARPAGELHNLIRGLSPRPGAWCRFDRGRHGVETVRLLRSRRCDPPTLPAGAPKPLPGEITSVEGGRLLAATADAGLELIELQPQNARVMTAADFINGRRLTAGLRLLDG
jgi:methionyl-tRNA formyltransferase